MSERRDPTLGALPDPASVDARSERAPQRGRQPVQRARRRWPWLLAVAVVLAAAFGLYHWRDALGRRLAPPPEQTQLMRKADAALRAGHLASPDGSGARELYQAVLARDPDRLAAREGLVHVGAAALAQAQLAVRTNHPQDARREIDLARDLGVAVADLQPVEEALQRGGDSDDRLASLLVQAEVAEHAGHLDDGAASALAIYQQALAAAPDNAVVLARRQALLAQMLAGIDALLAQGDVAGARKLVDRVAAVDPGDFDLPAARARLAEATQKRQDAQAHVLDAADADLRAGRRDAAVSAYRKVLADVPDNLRARAGLRSAGEALVVEANRAAADFDFPRAEAALAQARAFAPELPTLRAAEQHLRLARARRANIPTMASKASVDDLLAAADHAIVRDQLVDPPGDSAYDKLRAASAIAPGDPRVIAATKRFAVTAVACYQREMTGNQLARAEACLDALIAMQPSYAHLSSMRQELAARWLAVADERLGAGELDTAQRAIASAQRWTPNNPAIPALQTRLQQARAGAHH
jgi:tetratricopeptide (TPR) repeat protein